MELFRIGGSLTAWLSALLCLGAAGCSRPCITAPADEHEAALISTLENDVRLRGSSRWHGFDWQSVTPPLCVTSISAGFAFAPMSAELRLGSGATGHVCWDSPGSYAVYSSKVPEQDRTHCHENR